MLVDNGDRTDPANSNAPERPVCPDPGCTGLVEKGDTVSICEVHRPASAERLRRQRRRIHGARRPARVR